MKQETLIQIWGTFHHFSKKSETTNKYRQHIKSVNQPKISAKDKHIFRMFGTSPGIFSPRGVFFFFSTIFGPSEVDHFLPR